MCAHRNPLVVLSVSSAILVGVLVLWADPRTPSRPTNPLPSPNAPGATSDRSGGAKPPEPSGKPAHSRSARAAVSGQAGLDFFEKRIRPVLVAECYQCHSAQAEKLRGKLRLDSREAMLRGGSSGVPAVVPGKVEESLIIAALRHDGLEMPPKKKLPAAVIADFEHWIRLGAPMPAEAAGNVAGTPEAGRQHWAFQPLRRVAVPAVRHSAWPRTAVDRFLLAAMEAKGVVPLADADRHTLLRRLYFDLIGLPPTPEEIAAFVADNSPDAWEKVVDRLLASPHFGERWGRHWLDVVRYADSNGKDEDFTFYQAWRYRDYVIASFNRDKPYDQFVREQIAGDLMPAESQQQRDERLIATGFLVIGPKVLAERDKAKLKMDVVDEQLDTLGKALLGLSLGCARCHDHKFDPISTREYYALAGIFTSTITLEGIKGNNVVISGWVERPLGADGEKRLREYLTFAKKLQPLRDQLNKAQAELKAAESKTGMRSVSALRGIVVDDTQAQKIGEWKASTYAQPYVGQGYVHDDRAGKGQKRIIYTPKLPKAGEYEVLISYTTGDSRDTRVPVIIRHSRGETVVHVNQRQKPNVDGLFQRLGVFHFEAGTSGSVTISNAHTTGHVIADAVLFRPAGELAKDAAMQEMLTGVPESVAEQIRALRQRVEQLQKEMADLEKQRPPQPEMCMSVREAPTPGNCRIHIRGNHEQLGPEVPRGFLEVLTNGTPPTIPPDQSGRLQLAEWLTIHAHPLLARVMVNRIWQHLFGEGLVASVDNFGTTGDKPTHPELLDYLADEFIRHGWSVKGLIRQLVLSRAYQLSSRVPEPLSAQLKHNMTVDPENQLLWRAHRKRLEAEVIRDVILCFSGQLDLTMGGSTVAEFSEWAVGPNARAKPDTEKIRRRSVYFPLIRNDLPPLFQVFDFANADVTTGRRDVTNVPSQALLLLNSPFVLEQARLGAQRLLQEGQTAEERIRLAYLRLLCRPPTPEEIQQAQQFLSDYAQALTPYLKPGQDAALEAWAAFCQALIGCTEFRYADPNSPRPSAPPTS
ncbi:Xanthan lyase [bacterium HR36]|nr:Xanthan lyase [bacterium HR36]